MFIQPSNNNTLLKEILDDIKCIKTDIASIKSEMNIIKRHLEIVSDHTIKFDQHIDFIENKFNWYKGTLDFLQYYLSFKFLGGSNHNQFFIK
jgi:hypothetical protein